MLIRLGFISVDAHLVNSLGVSIYSVCICVFDIRSTPYNVAPSPHGSTWVLFIQNQIVCCTLYIVWEGIIRHPWMYY